jgi:hypothetical protein
MVPNYEKCTFLIKYLVSCLLTKISFFCGAAMSALPA